MFYFTYRNGTFYVNHFDGGQRAKSKKGIWNKIRANAAFAQDMRQRGYVRIVYRPVTGSSKHVLLDRGGQKVVSY
jgi:hypothetical protein